MDIDDKTWKLLLIEDDEDDYILTVNWLNEAREGRFDLRWTSNYADALYTLTHESFDAILVDYDLGGRNGLELVRQAIQNGITAPFILVTGRGSYEVDVEAMQSGVSEYLSKYDLSGQLLERTIRYTLDRKRSAEELYEAYQEVESLVEERTAALRAEIEERRRIEQELKASEARFRAIFDQSANGITLLNQDGTYLEANSAFLDMTGYAIDEIINRHYLDLTHPPDKEQDQASLQKLLDGEFDSYRMEKQLIHKDGSLVHIRLIRALIRDADGNPMFVLGLYEEIPSPRPHAAIPTEETSTSFESTLRQLMINIRPPGDPA
jgi:PAS domain S-box-containing protein